MTELFRTVLEMSITGAIIIAAVMLIRLCMKKLPRRYAYFLWIIPAIRLLCPMSVSSEASLFNLFPTQSVEVEYTEQVAAEQTVEPIETVIPQETTPVVTVHYPDQPAQPSPPQNIVNEKQPTEEAVPSRKVSAISVVSAVWLVGAAAMLVYVASSYIRTYRRIRNAALLQNNIFISHSIDTPFVFGLIKPKIYIPDGISGADLQYILAHENAHIKRLDHIAKMLAMVILSVHWFNPLVWLGFKFMTDDMELSCDEKALGSYDMEDRKAYATTLLNMSVRQNKLNLGGMLSFGESGIKTRIKGVLAMKKPKAIACVLAVAVIIVAAVCLLTSAKKLVIEDGERASVTVGGFYAVHGDKTADLDPQEIAKLLNSFNVKKISGTDVYRPENPTVYEIDIFIKGNMGYDQISFLSPICDQGDFKYIVVTKVRVNDNEPNIERDGFYKLTDNDYDKLCKAIVPKFEAFPEGNYVSTQLEHQIMRVTKENGIPHFELYEDDERIWAFDPDRFEAAGLVAVAGKDEHGITKVRHIGNGAIDVDLPLTSSIFAASPFVWQETLIDKAEDDNTFTAVVIEEQTDGIYGNYLVRPIEGEWELSSSDKFYISAETGLKQGELLKITHDGRIMETYPAQVEELSVERVTTVSPDNAVRQYYYAENNAEANKIKIAQNSSTIAWQYKSLSEKFGIAEDSELLEAIVDYTANGVSQSVVAVIESNQQFGFRVVDTFPYEPKSLYGTILEVTETDIDGSKQFYIVQPEGTSEEVRVYSFAMYGDYITGDATNTFKVGDKVEVKYNGNLEYGRDGNNRVFSMKAVENQLAPELTLCENYLNDYWNDLFKTGTFTPEDYISDPSMLALANARKQQNADIVGSEEVADAEIVVDNNSVKSGTTSDGKTWIYFVYDVQLNMENGTLSTEGYKGYTAYFELDGDNKIYREYRLWGAEKEVLRLDDEFTLPLENADINSIIDSITKRLAPEKIDPKPYTITSQVYKATEHGYTLDNDNSTQLEISFELPENWDLKRSTADLDGEKIFEIGVPYPESQGINYDDFKTDEVVGREITVHGEKIGTDSDPFEYYINTSTPDYYSDDGTYDMYAFVVNSGGYNLYMHFVTDTGVEYEVFEQVLRSVTIKELPPAVEDEPVPVADTDYIPDADEVFHTAVNPEGTAYNIQFEKLAGTEDAKDLNKYKNEILTYINEKISNSKNIVSLRSSDIDFNNEELVQGVKVHGFYSDYSPDAEYDKVMSALESESVVWKILIQNEYTAAYLVIHHCNNDKCVGQRFGEDWCIINDKVSRATAKTYTTATDIYAEYAAAEKILNKYVKANKNDDIKVVYASIGQPDPMEHYYIDGGIVFVNGVAKYIYSSGFSIYNDRMKPETPEDIVQKMNFDDLYLVRTAEVGSTDYEGIFDYNEVMSVIKVYEKYSMYT